MSYKSDIPPFRRGFYVDNNGDDDWVGKSLQTPKKTLQGGLDAAALATPPPGILDPVVVYTPNGGTFFETITVPSGVILYLFNVSRVTSITVESGGTFIIDSDAIDIDLIVEAGGRASLMCMGFATGNYSGDGFFNLIAMEFAGTIDPALTVNGVAGGQRYGNWQIAVEELITTELDPDRIMVPNGLGGVQWVDRYADYVEVASVTPASTTNDYDVTPVQYINQNIVTTASPNGLYEIAFSFTAGNSATNRRTVVGLFIDNVLQFTEYEKESKSADDAPYAAKVFTSILTAGAHNIRVDYGRRGGGGGATAEIIEARVNLKRVR